MSDKSRTYKVAAIGKQLLSDQVYEALKTAIVNGDLAPDTRLVEIEVAAQMNVSPTPVREAFKRMAAEGFVTIMPWRGVKVRKVNDRDILETYQCQEVLEGLAARLAAQEIDEEGIKKLQHLLEQSHKAQSPTEVSRLNSEFHNTILSYARNNRLKSILSLFQEIIVRHRHVTAYSGERCHQIHQEHGEIVKAIQNRDGKMAEKAMRRHVQSGLTNFIQRKEAHPKSSSHKTS